METNQQQLKKIIIDYLKEKEAVPRKEIIEYIRKNNLDENKNCKFTHGNFAGTFNQLQKEGKIKAVSRGIYALSYEISCNSEFKQEIVNLLNQTLMDFSEILEDQKDWLSLSPDELLFAKSVKESLEELIKRS